MLNHFELIVLIGGERLCSCCPVLTPCHIRPPCRDVLLGTRRRRKCGENEKSGDHAPGRHCASERMKVSSQKRDNLPFGPMTFRRRRNSPDSEPAHRYHWPPARLQGQVCGPLL